MPAVIPASVWDQLPIVAVFAALAWFAFREFRATLRDVVAEQQAFFAAQRQQDREILERLAEQVDHIGASMQEHDQMTRSAIAKMDERTRPKPTTKPGRTQQQ